MEAKLGSAVAATETYACNFLSLAITPGFYLKVVLLGLTTITSLFWRIPATGYSGMNTPLQELIFSHTCPGYLTIFFGLVVIYLLGDRPDRWFYYVFYGTGIVQMLLVGWIGVYNCMFVPNDWGLPPLFMAFSNILTGIVMIGDLFVSTGLFGLVDRIRSRMDKGKGDDELPQENKI